MDMENGRYQFCKGSKIKTVELSRSGEKWFDHETGKGGGPRDLSKLVAEHRNLQANRKTSSIIRATDVVMRAKNWLWKGHLLRGALELLAGIPGLGKSQVQCSYVACATAGLPWPDGYPRHSTHGRNHGNRRRPT